MIVAVGHDLVEVERVRKLLSTGRPERLFTPAELAYCARLSDPAPSFAARFAAKEAFQKVWPRPHGWRDVWVEREPTPAGPFAYAPPRLAFAPAIAAELRERGWAAHLSLTHTAQHASAVVILEQVGSQLRDEHSILAK